MGENWLTRRKSAPRRSSDANASALSPDSAAAKTLAERETAVRSGEEVALSRAGASDLREEAIDLREEATDLREGVATLREKTLRGQEDTARVQAKLNASGGMQLREANENLVVAAVRTQAKIESAEQATAQMSHLAEHDFLTGLPNRALLTDRLAQSIALSQRHGKKVALMYLDVDHFKHINDTLGHAVGDQLLQSIAKRLQACVRLSDTVSRHGGDEFVVLLAEVDELRDATLSAEKLIEAVARPHLIDGHQLHVTLSIGISLYPDDGKDAETVVQNADTAMYYAKRSGRNNYQLFTPDMDTRAVERQSIEAALHHALDQHEFVLHYQPKVNLETSAITGAEALLRMLQADHRLTSSTEFVSVAEESDLILPIGRWVLREACRQAQAWLQAGLDLGQIAVNISSREFYSKDFLDGIRAILNDTGLNPHYLELEMTESVLMQDTEQTTAILHALKDLGVRIAVDDFGTGYSSLSHLRIFQIDTLKIDQSFVLNIDDDSDNAIIVNAIIVMGNSLKQRVVAEGIETRQQLAFLQSHGCAEGQGYYLGHPVAAEEFASLLAADLHKQPNEFS